MKDRISKPVNNIAKTKELILYIINKCPNISKDTLCTMLYFIDMDYFEKNEKHLMGLEYRK